MADADDFIGRAILMLPLGKKQKRPIRVTSVSKSGKEIVVGSTKLKVIDEGKTWTWAPERRTGSIIVSTVASDRPRAATRTELVGLISGIEPTLPKAFRQQLLQSVLEPSLFFAYGSCIQISDPHSTSDILIELPCEDRYSDCTLLCSPCCMHDQHVFFVAKEPWESGPSDGRAVTRLLRLAPPFSNGTLPETVTELGGNLLEARWCKDGLVTLAETDDEGGNGNRLEVHRWDGSHGWARPARELPGVEYADHIASDVDGGYIISCTGASDGDYMNEDSHPLVLLKGFSTLAPVAWDAGEALANLILQRCGRRGVHFNPVLLARAQNASHVSTYIVAHSEENNADGVTCHVIRACVASSGVLQMTAEALLTAERGVRLAVVNDFVYVYTCGVAGAHSWHAFHAQSLEMSLDALPVHFPRGQNCPDPKSNYFTSMEQFISCGRLGS